MLRDQLLLHVSRQGRDGQTGRHWRSFDLDQRSSVGLLGRWLACDPLADHSGFFLAMWMQHAEGVRLQLLLRFSCGPDLQSNSEHDGLYDVCCLEYAKPDMQHDDDLSDGADDGHDFLQLCLYSQML